VKGANWFRFITTWLVALGVAGTSGCFWREKDTAQSPSGYPAGAGAATNVVATPIRTTIGRIASVNAQAKFAVINFPVGQVPANETRLAVFHAGVKSGEIRITGPAQENFTVGDIISGSAQEGDEVRAE
jgi:hypothetical protein